MNRVALTLSVLALCTAAAPDRLPAQERWGVEFRATGGVAAQEAGPDANEPVFGFGAAVEVRVMPHLALYGGWDWSHTRALEAVAGPDVDLEETGYSLGARFEHPLGGGSTRGWLRAGALYDHFEVEDADGDLIDDSGHGLGWELGAGVALGVADRWSLLPGVRFRSLGRTVDFGDGPVDLDVRAVTLEVGIRRSF